MFRVLGIYNFGTEVDKAKNCCRIGCTQPLSGLNRVTARGFNRAPAAWMRMQKKSAVITAKAKRNHAHRFDTPHRISGSVASHNELELF